MFNNHNTRGCKKQYLTAETFHKAVTLLLRFVGGAS